MKKRITFFALFALLCGLQALAGNMEFAGTEYGTVSLAMLVPILGIIFGCSFPILIVFLVFYFRHKNRKAKYHLMEQALASGQPIPENFFSTLNETVRDDNRSKGFRNLFLGIGLFLFLWLLTGELGVASIGSLISFIGIGQLCVHYTQEGNPEKNDKPTPTEPRAE